MNEGKYTGGKVYNWAIESEFREHMIELDKIAKKIEKNENNIQ